MKQLTLKSIKPLAKERQVFLSVIPNNFNCDKCTEWVRSGNHEITWSVEPGNHEIVWSDESGAMEVRQYFCNKHTLDLVHIENVTLETKSIKSMTYTSGKENQRFFFTLNPGMTPDEIEEARKWFIGNMENGAKDEEA